MSTWKVKSKTEGKPDFLDSMLWAAAGGTIVDIVLGDDPVIKKSDTYTIENTKTGEQREVKANSTEDLGKKIASGDI